MDVVEYRSRRQWAKVIRRKIRLDDFYLRLRHGETRDGAEEEGEGAPGIISFALGGAQRSLLVTVNHGLGLSPQNKVVEVFSLKWGFFLNKVVQFILV